MRSTDYLNQVLVISEEKNMTRAAERLHISQPALTASINKLEEELGVKLLNRSKHPVMLTPAGVLYIQEMKKIEQQRFSLKNRLIQMNDKKIEFRMGFGFGRGGLWLPIILPDLIAEFPDRRFSVVFGNYDKLEKEIESGHIDAAFGSLNISQEAFSSMHIVNENLIYLIPKKLGLIDDRTQSSPQAPIQIEPSLLNGLPFICTNMGSSYRRFLELEMNEMGFRLGEPFFCDDPTLAVRLACAGVGLTYTAALHMQTAGIMYNTADIHFCTIKEKPTQLNVSMFFPREKASSPILSRIMDIIRRRIIPEIYGHGNLPISFPAVGKEEHV